MTASYLRWRRRPCSLTDSVRSAVTRRRCPSLRRDAMSDFASLVPQAPHGRFDGIERPYSAAEVERLRGSFPISYTLAERGANTPVAAAARRALHQRAGRRHRQPGHADGRAPGSRPSTCRAGRSRPTPTPPAPCIPTSRSTRPTPRRSCAAASTAPCSAPTRSSERGRRQARLVRPHRGGRRGRLRRPAEQLRDHEGLHRGRRRGRPLRGPARLARRSAATWAARC